MLCGGGGRKETHTRTYTQLSLYPLSLCVYYTSFDSFFPDAHTQTSRHFISPHLFLIIDLQQLQSDIKLHEQLSSCLCVCVRRRCLKAGHLILWWNSQLCTGSSEQSAYIRFAPVGIFIFGDSWKLEEGTVWRLLSLSVEVPSCTFQFQYFLTSVIFLLLCKLTKYFTIEGIQW